MRKILYSNDMVSRIARHLLFWLVLYLLSYSSTIIFSYPRYQFQGDIKLLFVTDKLIVAYFLIDILCCYIFIYVLYFQFKRHGNIVRFVMQFILLLALTFVFKCIIRYFLYDVWNKSFEAYANHAWITFITFLNFGPAIKSILFLSCKLLKDYHVKMERLNRLVVETSQAELQLLKAQVHPHFLFNTLNNIYSSLITKRMNASELIGKLRNTALYMIRDCQSPVVPLVKEIEMIRDYIELERIRYGDRLNVQMKVRGECHDKMITPLLIVPVVENCFKHGSSQTIERSWVIVDFMITDEMAYINIENSRPPAENGDTKRSGIGLANVKKRMELLFRSRGVFEVRASSDSFKVNLAIPINIAQGIPDVNKIPAMHIA